MQIKNLVIACIVSLGCEAVAAQGAPNSAVPILSSAASSPTVASSSVGASSLPSSFTFLPSAKVSRQKRLVHASATPTSSSAPIASATMLPDASESKLPASFGPTPYPSSSGNPSSTGVTRRVKIRRQAQSRGEPASSSLSSTGPITWSATSKPSSTPSPTPDTSSGSGSSNRLGSLGKFLGRA